MASPKKQLKRATSFNEKWLAEKSWLRKISQETALCTICRIQFTVANKGFRALVDHESSNKHKTNQNAANCSKVLDSFFIVKDTADEHLTIAAEIAHIMHCIKHNQSYISLDCCFKLLKVTHGENWRKN